MERFHLPIHELFRRHPQNPILTPDRWAYPVSAVFNPAAVPYNGGVLLLVRCEDWRGFSHLTAAWSPDGVGDWRVPESPTLEASAEHGEGLWGLEDPRAVWLEEEGVYAVTYVSFSRGGPVVSLATTEDFRTFHRIGRVMPPEDKDAALLPRRFGGRYALIHRPIVRGEAHIWMAFSPDLRHWGDHRVLIPARPGWWDGQRVGLGPPPIETPEGWLVIYHGVRQTVAGQLYRVGLALLDLEEPWHVLRRAPEWVMGPQERYEWEGDVPGVVFPTGALWNPEADELRVYYGAADRVIGLAYAHLTDILDYLRTCPRE
jgi:predicted GH43/DUF377 family glycosyl hydrolase